MAAPSMNGIAERYRDHKVGSIFLYTYEAHPGENYPHLTSMSQKYEHARALRDVLGVTRPIMVDALDGACHRAYGSMPNMTWIFNKAGVPLYKSDWTDAHSVENALQYFLKVLDRRRAGEKAAPFHVERIDFRQRDMEKFYEGLERNGPKAVKEFREAFNPPL
jgi:hypothetical protein